jgi:integrase
VLYAPDFIAARDTGTGETATRFWLAMTALLTGGRSTELIAAKVSDLEFHGESWMLRAREASRQRFQEAPSRWVPLHEELIRCGFLA